MERVPQEIEQVLGSRTPGRRYGRVIRDQVGAWICSQREAGAKLTELARALDLSTQTLRRWSKEAALADTESGSRSLREVQVVDEPATVSVVSPSGYRVDGLSLRDAAALLRELA